MSKAWRGSPGGGGGGDDGDEDEVGGREGGEEGALTKTQMMVKQAFNFEAVSFLFVCFFSLLNVSSCSFCSSWGKKTCGRTSGVYSVLSYCFRHLFPALPLSCLMKTESDSPREGGVGGGREEGEGGSGALSTPSSSRSVPFSGGQ